MQRRTHINVTAAPAITPGTTVSVYTDSGLTILASLYDDAGAAKTNPVVVDANGEFYYRAADGKYYEVIQGQPAAELTFFDSTAANHLTFYTAPTGVPLTVGTVYWNNVDKCLDVRSENLLQQLGQEFVIRALNLTGSTISDALPVSIPQTNAASGDRMKIEITDVLTGATCMCFIGTTTETISQGNEGFVTRIGLVRDVDTTGASHGETWSEGDRLWVRAGGGLTNVAPTKGNKALVGMVIKKNANTGMIFSNPRYFELSTPYYKAGIADRSESTISFNDGTRTFTIAPTDTYFWVYLGAAPDGKTSQAVVIPNTVGQHYVYFDATTKALTAATSVWDIEGNSAPVATIYWDGSSGWVCDERHKPRDTFQRSVHAMLHSTIGARYSSGLTGTFTNTTLSITTGTIFDEDIPHTLSGTATTCRLIYRNASLQMVDSPGSSTPYAVSAGALQYDNAGTLTAVGANQFVNNWVYMTNDKDYPIYVQVGQQTFATVNQARNAAQIFPSNISTREWKVLYKAIYQNVGGTPTFVEATDFRTQSTLAGGTVSSLPASAVTFTAAGNISATNAQAAIEELDNEKLAASGGTITNYKETLYAVTTAGNVTIDLANGNVQRYILDAARQFTMPADPGAYGQSFILRINCAGFTPTWNSTPTLVWLTSDGTAPTLNTTSGKINVLCFTWDDVLGRWEGYLAGKET